MRRRVREGDREAFAELYEQFAGAVYNHGLRLTGDWSTAEDIMSETFLAAWRNRAAVEEDGGTLLPWLLGIAGNKVHNARRGARRRQMFLARQPPPAPVEDFASREAGRIDDVRRLRAVQESLGRLRPQEREVLALCVWSALSYRQAAQALGVSVGTVRSRLSRARSKLARLAEEKREPSGGRGEMTGVAVFAAVPAREEMT
ncbi:RNA polymerase sigma factor [Streptomyces coelicoflavus]|uniref:RNA polymerase sigma factor n=1 Tax=Streptomyces TaxID=1883 RepID=UPI001291782A|nr:MULTISPECIES: RNA polymerase sigma factor [unclassified Streptomyces]MBQ0952995.1 RNA polymerase sigma factor [Streptomyces sp. RK76]QFX86923.1 sigma-70 family RNA polymerase sigma factor [Streptomyces sp. SYP-A7193]